MRTILLLAAAAVAAALVVGSAGGAAPRVGTLSLEGGKGTVTVEIRGNVIGRIATGTVRVIDQTPRDRFVAFVQGRKLKTTRLNPRATLYKGQWLRFRAVGGTWKLVIKGSGISVSAVGRGFVTMDADRLVPEDEAGVFSLETGVDCSVDATLCTPLPDEAERYAIAPPKPTPTTRNAAR
jgi:hypothetical protein